MSDPNEVVLVIRRDKAQQLHDALKASGGLTEYLALLEELESKLAEALRESRDSLRRTT